MSPPALSAEPDEVSKGCVSPALREQLTKRGHRIRCPRLCRSVSTAPERLASQPTYAPEQSEETSVGIGWKVSLSLTGNGVGHAQNRLKLTNLALNVGGNCPLCQFSGGDYSVRFWKRRSNNIKEQLTETIAEHMRFVKYASCKQHADITSFLV
jgi:hypothetical protein